MFVCLVVHLFLCVGTDRDTLWYKVDLWLWEGSKTIKLLVDAAESDQDCQTNQRFI